MDSVLYTQILDKYLLPFIEKQFHGTEYRFMQDNDPKHTSRVAKGFYQAKGINWWPTPANSADFNPIEGVWRELKHFIEALEQKGTDGWTLFALEEKDDTREMYQVHRSHLHCLAKIVAKKG